MPTVFFRKEPPTLEPVPDILLADLEQLYSAVAPMRMFDIDAMRVAVLPGRQQTRSTWQFALATTALTVAIVGAILAVPAFREGGTTTVSAAGIIEKVRAASSSDVSFYRSHSNTMPDAGGQPTLQTFKLWYQDALHWKSEIYETDSITGKAGRFLAGEARDGDEYWIYFQDGETLRVINRDATVSGGGATVDWSLASSLDEALVSYGGACGTEATVAKGEDIAGRRASKVSFVVDHDACPDLISQTLWIDETTLLPLRHESVGREGRLTSVIDELVVGPISDDQVTFVPPSGTWVNYQDRGESIQVP